MINFYDPVLIIGAENGLVWCNLGYFPDVRCSCDQSNRSD